MSFVVPAAPGASVEIAGRDDLFSVRRIICIARNFHLEEFWALTLVLFVFALGPSALIGKMEHKVKYYAGVRG